MKKILIVAGTRPEIIKVAPILLAARDRSDKKVEVKLCLTGQHESMANEALSIFGIEGDENLRIMGANQTPNDVSAAIFQKLPDALRRFGPDVVLVQGDTTSAAAAALCAFNMHIPVAHVEAGLRSHDLAAPFPEEMNRKLVTCASRYNFCPTKEARQNLVHESVARTSLYLTGNTIVDALRIIGQTHDLNDLAAIHASLRKPFVLVTAHRRESFGPGIEHICDALKQCSTKFPGHQFVYPVHLNPNINTPVRERLSGLSNILLLPPVSYLGLPTLLSNCELVVSDSGGIQEEAPSFGKYCIVLRDVTERMESVALGISELVGTDTSKIVKAVARRLKNHGSVKRTKNPYGDGHAAERIIRILIGGGART